MDLQKPLVYQLKTCEALGTCCRLECILQAQCFHSIQEKNAIELKEIDYTDYTKYATHRDYVSLLLKIGVRQIIISKVRIWKECALEQEGGIGVRSTGRLHIVQFFPEPEYKYIPR